MLTLFSVFWHGAGRRRKPKKTPGAPPFWTSGDKMSKLTFG
jgi:hypothetical protein